MRIFEASETLATADNLISVTCAAILQSGTTMSVRMTPTLHQKAGAEPTIQQTLCGPRSNVPQSTDCVRHNTGIKLSDILCCFVVPESVLWAFTNPTTPHMSPRIHCLRLILGKSRSVSVLERRRK
jgi:hypothetical protein